MKCPREVWIVFDEGGLSWAYAYVEQDLSKLPGKTQQRYVLAPIAPAVAAGEVERVLRLAKEALGDWEDGTGETHDHYCPNCDNSIDGNRKVRDAIDAMLRALAPKAPAEAAQGEVEDDCLIEGKEASLMAFAKWSEANNPKIGGLSVFLLFDAGYTAALAPKAAQDK